MSSWTISQRTENETMSEFLIEPGGEDGDRGVAIVARSFKTDGKEEDVIFQFPVAEARALADVIRSVARVVEETQEPK